MATYRAVEPPPQIAESRDVTALDPDIPRSKPQYTFRSVESHTFKPYATWPRTYETIVESYVWIGPGGDFDSEHAYWG